MVYGCMALYVVCIQPLYGCMAYTQCVTMSARCMAPIQQKSCCMAVFWLYGWTGCMAPIQQKSGVLRGQSVGMVASLEMFVVLVCHTTPQVLHMTHIHA